jgi:acyl-[acyl-carrier-protein]-phospholipid O-acyltransferase/long-chain-fatty-acid--[acyl-carrier-protein] ligase
MNAMPDAPPNLALSAGPRSRRGFWALWITQFQGAFSDNLHKFLVLYLALGLGLPPEREHALVPLVNALFAVPFLLFSMTGGWLADRFSKRTVCIGVKLAEVAIMGLATAALANVSIPAMLAAVFLMSTQSALFGPTKYGLMPELLPGSRLSWGNGLLGLGTFLAIILGTMAAGGLMEWWGRRQVVSGFILVGLALLGTLTSLALPRVPPANPQRRFQWNPLADFWQEWRLVRTDPVLTASVLMVNFLWFLAALWQPALIFYCRDVLGGGELNTSLLQAGMAVGIGLGSLAAGFLSGGRIEPGLVPLGALGMVTAALVLGLGTVRFTEALIWVALLGFCGGLYHVPLNALLQARPDPGRRGGVLAASAFLSWVGIVAASGPVYYLLTRGLGLDSRGIFVTGALLTLVALATWIWMRPEVMIHFARWVLVRTSHPLRVLGGHHVPRTGGALLVCNHQSLVDWLLLIAAVDRPIRFLMDRRFAENRWLRRFARALEVIPVASRDGPHALARSLEAARQALCAGQVVCLFPEGQMTRTGHLLGFRRGLERVVRGTGAPIIPAAMEGVWGGPFSFPHRRYGFRWPRRWIQPVTVLFGTPLPDATPAAEVRHAVEVLLSELWTLHAQGYPPLQRRFVRTARRHPLRLAMADERVGGVSFARALVGAVLVADRLRSHWAGDERVGVFLPPCVPAALVHWAALLAGKVPVYFNYTLDPGTLAHCIRLAGVRSVISSARFLEKVRIEIPVPVLTLEDLLARVRPREKLRAMMRAWLLPAPWLERSLRDRSARMAGPHQPDRPATIIFSSGSTGEPKGAVLTHANILANIEQAARIIDFHSRDRLLGVLPFFHSFGFTVGVTLPGVLGLGVAFHPNPLDSRALAPLLRRWKVTILLSTPTFLQLYIRGFEPEDVRSLRLVITGAEKLPMRVAEAFAERFGIRPLEGYGCTECGPIVSVNIPDLASGGLYQQGHKPGSVGRPLPGVAVAVRDPETLEPLPIGREGVLCVRGPNIMPGYWLRPDLTQSVLRDGWYVTGDVARVDEEGFIHITDRLARFSKIGGEMVPHVRVEEVLHELVGATERTFVVTAVPDENRGERLVVLHRLDSESLQVCLERLRATPLLPNLWKPRPEHFHRVETFPTLASGKLDLLRCRLLAKELLLQPTGAGA